VIGCDPQETHLVRVETTTAIEALRDHLQTIGIQVGVSAYPVTVKGSDRAEVRLTGGTEIHGFSLSKGVRR